MEFEFDKEIDAILRKARESEFVFADNPKSQVVNPELIHLDADEISAFAENALPEKSKQLYMKHLAECDRCRRILSNLMILNSEAGTIPAFVSASETIVETPVPWYRKLFAMPNLAYTMGACVLIFGGILGVLVLQNFKDSSVSVSKVSETQPKERGPYINQDAPIPSSNTAMSNAAMNTSAMSANTSANAANVSSSAGVVPDDETGGAPPSPTNRAVSSNSAAVTRDDKFADKSELSRSAPPVSATPPEPEADIQKNRVLSEKEIEGADNVPKPVTAPAPAQMQPPVPTSADEQAEERKRKISPKKASRSSETALNDSSTTGAAATVTKQVGGKTFRRVDSMWIDNNYRQGTNTIRISRGSNEYRKLDGGLRNIAEQFDGVVIIVWKSKGYRIQ
jgi:hypothetical protein